MMKWRWPAVGHARQDTAQEIRRMQLEALITHASMLEGRLRQLASKWRAQARHPQRRFRPAERELLHKHADELLGELNVDKLLRPRDKDGD